MGKWGLAVLLIFLLVLGTGTWYSWETGRYWLQLESLLYPGKLFLGERKEVAFFMKELAKSEISSGQSAAPGLFRLLVHKGGREESYLLKNTETLWLEGGNKIILCTPELQASLSQALHKLQDGTPFGAPYTWSEVKELFPRYTSVTIKDVETGKSFTVQRRGGSYHADVQPLTAQDAKVLKELYHGGWSWQRRAIVVQIGYLNIAASMNGMPHGSGKIKGNNFPGHFCLHFRESQVHKSRQVDRAHQMMVWKAAGVPETMFKKATPEEIIYLTLTALDQQDGGLLSLGLLPEKGQEKELSTTLVREIASISVEKLNRIKEQELLPNQVLVQLKVALYYSSAPAKKKKEGTLELIQDPLSERWYLTSSSLRDLLL